MKVVLATYPPTPSLPGHCGVIYALNPAVWHCNRQACLRTRKYDGNLEAALAVASAVLSTGLAGCLFKNTASILTKKRSGKCFLGGVHQGWCDLACQPGLKLGLYCHGEHREPSGARYENQWVRGMSVDSYTDCENSDL